MVGEIINVEGDLGVVFEFEIISYSPERSAPYCSDPSNPRYYDAGEPEEVEYEFTGKIWIDDIRMPLLKGVDFKRYFEDSGNYHEKIMEKIREKIREKKLDF